MSSSPPLARSVPCVVLKALTDLLGKEGLLFCENMVSSLLEQELGLTGPNLTCHFSSRAQIAVKIPFKNSGRNDSGAFILWCLLLEVEDFIILNYSKELGFLKMSKIPFTVKEEKEESLYMHLCLYPKILARESSWPPWAEPFPLPL